jgi:oxygen-independent coproporphyrinogen III oxidase
VVRSPRGYIERLAPGRTHDHGWPFSPALAERHVISREDEMGETMMVGMRLTDEGVSNKEFRARFGVDLAEAYGAALGELQGLSLIEWDGARARLTRPGRLLGNRVFRAFI